MASIAMPQTKIPNRWTIAMAAVVMQLCLGAVYGWSVFKIPLMRAHGWAETSVQLNFTLSVAFLGLGTIIGGLWQDRVGPRRVATVAGVLYGLGYILAAFAASHSSLTGHVSDLRRAGRVSAWAWATSPPWPRW